MQQSIIIDQEFKNLIPPLSVEEKAGLEEMIIKDGCRESLVTWGGTLVDGHNRFEICSRLGLNYKTIEMFFEDRSAVIEWIIRNQFGRRNLLPYDRTRLALRLECEIKERAKANQVSHGGTAPGKTLLPNWSEVNPAINTRKQVSNLAGVGEGTLYRVKIIEEKATPEVKAELSSGTKTINKAYEDIRKAEGNPVVKKAHIKKEVTGQEFESLKPGIKTNFAHNYAVMAMTNLDRIQKGDPQGAGALMEVMDYINQRIEKEFNK